MEIFQKADSHSDNRRDLTAFHPPKDFPRAIEVKMLIVKCDEVSLGNHSHPYKEGFFLVTGSCAIRTWRSKGGGVHKHHLVAPVMFMFSPNEEHELTMSKSSILVGYMPTKFKPKNTIPATHL